MKLLDSSARVTKQCKRHQEFSIFFATVEGLCFWHNVNGLFDSAGIPCIPSDWRLFIDRLSRSLKGVPTMETDIHLSHLPTQRISKKIMQMSKLFQLI